MEAGYASVTLKSIAADWTAGWGWDSDVAAMLLPAFVVACIETDLVLMSIYPDERCPFLKFAFLRFADKDSTMLLHSVCGWTSGSKVGSMLFRS